MTNIKRKLTAAQVRAIRSKQNAKKVEAATTANGAEAVVVEMKAKKVAGPRVLSTEAVRTQIDLSSNDIVRDETGRGVGRVTVQNGDVKITAFGRIADDIEANKRVDGYALVREGSIKVVGYMDGDVVLDENGAAYVEAQPEVAAAA